MEGKSCPNCGVHYPDVSVAFARNRSTASGFQTWCRACCRLHRQAKYQANPELVKRKVREWQIAHPDKLNETKRRGYYRNKERNAEKRREYRARNRDRINAKTRAWRESNQEHMRQYRMEHRAENAAAASKRRGLEHQAPGSHTAQDIARQYEAQRGACYWCKRPVGNAYHVDHVIPISRGGSNGRDNIVVACPPCNLAKKAKMPDEWAGVLL